jgi:hypothetical protein
MEIALETNKSITDIGMCDTDIEEENFIAITEALQRNKTLTKPVYLKMTCHHNDDM